MPFAEEDRENLEAAALVRRLAVRHEPPEGLVRHYARLAEEAAREKRAARFTLWRAALAGALAASVAVLALTAAVEWLGDEENPYEIIAQEAGPLYRRLARNPVAAGARRTPLSALLSSLRNRFDYQPRLALPGKEPFIIEGGFVREVHGQEMASLLYRAKDARLMLLVMNNDEPGELPAMLRGGWAAVSPGSPRIFVWTRGDLVFALVGDAPLEKFREISQALSPPEENF